VNGSVALQTAVAENLPGLHAGEDVLDAGTDLPVGRAVGFLSAGRGFVPAAAVGHDESGAGIAASAIVMVLLMAALAPDPSHAL
jgi:hypothetical protein